MSENDKTEKSVEPSVDEGDAFVSPWMDITMHILEKKAEKQAREAREKSSTEGIKFSIETITPSDAARYLENVNRAKLNADGELRISDQAAVARYTQQMKEGLWILNGEPIIFDDKGAVLDGVSRLLACQEAKTAFKTVVARGVNPDVLHTIGAHARRTYAQILAARDDVKNAGVNAGRLLRNLIRLIRFERRDLGYSTGRVSWIDLDRTFDVVKKDLIAADTWASSRKQDNINQHVLPMVALFGIMSDEMRAVEVLTTSPDQISDANEKRIVRRMLNKLGSRDAGQADVMTQNMIYELAVVVRAMNELVTKRDMGSYEIIFREGYGEATRSGTRPIHACVEFYSEDNDEIVPKQRPILERLPRNAGIPHPENWPGCPVALRDGSTTEAGWVDAHLASMLRKAASESGEPQIEFMEVTPAIAETWLKRFNTGNRQIQPRQVKRIADDIRNGNWMVNAVPICFANDPSTGSARLLNGQHRLQAVFDSGQNIEVAVATGIHPNAFATYDQQSRHPVVPRTEKLDGRVAATVAKYFLYEEASGTVSDDGSSLAGLNMLEVPPELQVREIARYPETKRAITLMSRAFPSDTPTESQVDDFVEKYEEDLLKFYGLTRKFSDTAVKKSNAEFVERNAPKQCAPESVSTWLMFRAHREHAEIASDFCDYYVWRLNLERYQAGGKDDFLRSKEDRQMLHDLRAKQRENTANDKLMSELKKHADRREELKTPDIMKALYKIWRGYLAERLGVTVLELEARVPGLTGPKVEWYDVMVQGEKVKLPEVVSRTGADTPTGDQPELFAKT